MELLDSGMIDDDLLDLEPPLPANSRLMGIPTSLLYNGSRFQGHQKSKGNCYDVEVVLQVTKSMIDNSDE